MLNTKPRSLHICKRLLVCLLLQSALQAEAKKMHEHLDKLAQRIANAYVDFDDCTYEETLEALPYAELVLAHANPQVKDAVPPGYALLEREALPESLQEHFHYIEIVPSDSCLSEDLDDCLEYPLETIESHTLQSLGLKARIYESLEEHRLIIVFSGTEPELEKRPLRAAINWITNIRQSRGHCSLAYALALEWVQALQEAYPYHEIVCTGISLGGGLSQYVAGSLGLRAYCFNSPRLAGCQLESILAGDHSERIKHYTVELEILNLPLNFFRGKHVGSLCQIPSYNTKLNLFERHFTEHAIQSLKIHLQRTRHIAVKKALADKRRVRPSLG
ncbi:MAG TPA: hypothetical protein PLV25_01200 [Opitutales bacterium]|nr:hypothetical protein [Opitutales bacterium]